MLANVAHEELGVKGGGLRKLPLVISVCSLPGAGPGLAGHVGEGARAAQGANGAMVSASQREARRAYLSTRGAKLISPTLG